MNLFLIENDRKVEAGDYLQVGHRLVHRDDILLSGIAGAHIVTEDTSSANPVAGRNRYEITSSFIEDRYLRIDVHGEFDLQNSGKLIAEVMTLRDSAGCFGLLIDFHGTRLQFNTVEQFYLVHDLISSGCPDMGKMAVITADTQTGFFEKAARNRMIDLKFFSDSDTALAWLAV